MACPTLDRGTLPGSIDVKPVLESGGEMSRFVIKARVHGDSPRTETSMHATLKALAILTLAAATATAQGLGDLLRVHGPQGPIEGEVVRMDAGSLVLDQGKRKVVVARAQVDSMFRRGSYAKETTAGFGLFGALGGGFFAMNFAQGMCGGGPGCTGDATNALAGGAVVGGLLGALTGALIGSAMEKWVPIGEERSTPRRVLREGGPLREPLRRR